MRQILSTAIVALIVGSLAGVTVSTLAQEPAQTPQDEAVVTAGLNADTVDGKNAVSATSKKTQRKNKLVATDSKGYLPSNIVKPKWGLISQKPPAFADGQIGWNELAGIPGPFADGQIGWGEVQGIPAGFADGTDNTGVTGLRVTFVSATDTIPGVVGTVRNIQVTCPAGSRVVGGGHGATQGDVHNVTSQPFLNNWFAAWENTGTLAATINVYAICLSTEPAGNITQAGKITTAVKPKRGK